MCGICGFVDPRGVADEVAADRLLDMTARLRHRGPDSGGHWVSQQEGVGLGHRRLSIVELSSAGHQPMTSPGGRFIVVFNGEIYNHLDLRELTPGVTWRGNSDTESLLAGFDAMGIVRTLQEAVGMFALAVWDKRERALTLARDRLGEKPLYYGWQDGTLLFGSELNALAAHPAFVNSVDQEALATYLHYGFVPAPYSIYQGIRKLPPGSTWTWRAVDGVGAAPAPVPYWSLSEVIARGTAPNCRWSDQEAIDGLDELLKEAVRCQLMSDVPLGAFLSGGVDSSTVVALMQDLGAGPVKTFTIGYDEESHDEAATARAVAHHLGTDHSELLVTAGDALDALPRLGEVYDEPLGDVSALPTWLVAGLAANRVKVALSGDGGDEFFAGYWHYGRVTRVWEGLQRVPTPLRRVVRASLPLLPSNVIERQLVKRGLTQQPHLFGTRVHNLWHALGTKSIDELYLNRLGKWRDVPGLLQSKTQPGAIWAQSQSTPSDVPAERLMAIDARSYLPDDVLVKVDRAAMAHSLETRAPLLDHRVVEFALGLPHQLRQREGVGKWILRELLYRYVPRKLVDRPKQGFGVPLDDWLRGPLKEWADDLLSASMLEQHSPFNAEPIRRAWAEHLQGYDWQYKLWPILAYQQWATHNRGAK